MPGFTHTNVRAFCHDAIGKALRAVRYVRPRIYKYGREGRIIIGLAVQQQDTGMGRYSDLYLVANVQAAAAFEMFLSDEDKDVSQYFCLVRRRQQPVERHVSPDNHQPIIRKLLTRKSISSPSFESEHMRTSLSTTQPYVFIPDSGDNLNPEQECVM